MKRSIVKNSESFTIDTPHGCRLVTVVTFSCNHTAIRLIKALSRGWSVCYMCYLKNKEEPSDQPELPFGDVINVAITKTKRK